MSRFRGHAAYELGVQCGLALNACTTADEVRAFRKKWAEIVKPISLASWRFIDRHAAMVLHQLNRRRA